jgi:NADH-quinone oxidoreductase subunit M
MLSVVTFLPLAGAILLMLLPRNDNAFRWIALVTTLVNFILTLVITFSFDRGKAGYQYVEKVEWIPALGSSYHMGVDGVSVLMILVSGMLFFISVIASWKPIQKRVREYYISMLLLNIGCIGVFCALDFFLFYIMWELVLIPMAIMIGVWGGARRIYAATKFFLYTLVGSLLMLVAIIALYFQFQALTGRFTLDIVEITEGLRNRPFDATFQFWAFLAFALAFGIKVPMWPFHTWLPDAHTEAPTAGSVILAGVMLKLGCYGFIRFNLPMFPNASKDLALFMCILALIAIIYGAICSVVQPDMKKLVAYSSVSHMGFVILGLFSFAYGIDLGPNGNILLTENQQGFDGAVFTMFSHGLLTGGLFLCVGVIYDRLHTRDIKTIQNSLRVATRMPSYATVFMIFMMGSLGLPMISGFVGEFLAMQGAFRVSGWLAFTASFVIILAAVYMLWVYQRTIFGKVGDYDPAIAAKVGHDDHDSHGDSPGHGGDSHGHDHSDEHAHAGHNGHGHGHADKDMLKNGGKLPDLDPAETLTLYPLAIASIVFGVFPGLLLTFLERPAQSIIEAMINNSDQTSAITNVLQYLFK